MRVSASLFQVAAAVVASLLSLSQASAITEQTAANVFNTRPFLWLEAEN